MCVKGLKVIHAFTKSPNTLPEKDNGPPVNTIWQLVPVMVISHAVVKLQHL